MTRAEVMRRKKQKARIKAIKTGCVVLGMLAAILIVVSCAKNALLPPADSGQTEAKNSESQSSAKPSGTDSESESMTESETVSEPETSESQTESESSEKTTEKPTESEKPTEKPTESEKPTEIPSQVTIPDGEFKNYSGIYVLGNIAYESYNYGEAAATAYAGAVTTAADKLAGKAKVYDIIIPTNVGVCFPDEYKNKISDSNQKTSIDKIIGKMGANVINVPLYDTMAAHKTEYLYFRTDHHWTQLGAYYAYTQYCAKKGIEPEKLEEYEVKAYEGFLGTLYQKTKDPRLNKTPDTVYALYPHCSNTMMVTDKNGKQFKWPVIRDVTKDGSGSKYMAYIGGDQPFEEITNLDVTDGTACVVIKESFGNCFTPLLVDHFEKVYVIDYRYWDGSLYDLVEEKGITDVIFINNIGMTRSKSLVNNLKTLVER